MMMGMRKIISSGRSPTHGSTPRRSASAATVRANAIAYGLQRGDRGPAVGVEPSCTAAE
jgi:hypothetical protein